VRKGQPPASARDAETVLSDLQAGVVIPAASLSPATRVLHDSREDCNCTDDR
jgi:hypothetical protein